MDLTTSFYFLRPAWLLALPLLWSLTVWLARRQSEEGNWSRLIDPELLPDLRLANSEKPGRTPWPWLALAWTLAALALAGPSWQREASPAYRGSDAWVLVLDLSPSMIAADLSPNRYTRARYALDDLLTAAHDARVGLVVFSDEPYTVTPMTDDVATIRALLPPLNPDIMPSSGDNLAPALKQAGQLLAQGGSQHGRIIVLTDGFADPSEAFAEAGALRAKGDTVDVIGIGTAAGAPLGQAGGGFSLNAQGQVDMARLDPGRLQQVAAMGGGHYVALAGLPSLIADLQARPGLNGQATQKKGLAVEHWLDGGIWLLPALLLIAAVLARRGWL